MTSFVILNNTLSLNNLYMSPFIILQFYFLFKYWNIPQLDQKYLLLAFSLSIFVFKISPPK